MEEPPSRKARVVLTDDVVEEILLRLPPDDPASLARATLVCKRWHRVTSDAAFRRRFTAFHRHQATPPPMLGFLCNIKSGDAADTARFFPAAASYPRCYPDRRCDFALDARHGRVLLQCTRMASPPQGFDPDVVEPIDLVVWDPVTNEEHHLPVMFWHKRSRLAWNAAVLCAATTTCDHHDCHLGPSLVVFVGIADGRASAFVYSSETGAWTMPVSSHLGLHTTMVGPSILADDGVHFTVERGRKMLTYDLDKGVVEMFLTPDLPVVTINLVTTKHGRLGIAGMMGYNLFIWSRWVQYDAMYGWWWYWEPHRAIELDPLLFMDPFEPLSTFFVLGFAEGPGIIFIGTSGGIFTVDLNSSQVTKVLESGECYGIVPYVSFYTPRVPLST